MLLGMRIFFGLLTLFLFLGTLEAWGIFEDIPTYSPTQRVVYRSGFVSLLILLGAMCVAISLGTSTPRASDAFPAGPLPVLHHPAHSGPIIRGR